MSGLLLKLVRSLASPTRKNGGFVYTPVQSIRLLTMTTLPAKLDAIPAVDIDNGRFKYILIRVDLHNAETNEESSKVIVRGYTWAAFHGDIYDKVQAELEAIGLDTECLGGGRIFHDPTKGTLLVYGYSQGFGLADHSVTTDLLKTRYPDYQSITWSNEGY